MVGSGGRRRTETVGRLPFVVDMADPAVAVGWAYGWLAVVLLLKPELISPMLLWQTVVPLGLWISFRAVACWRPRRDRVGVRGSARWAKAAVAWAWAAGATVAVGVIALFSGYAGLDLLREIKSNPLLIQGYVAQGPWWIKLADILASGSPAIVGVLSASTSELPRMRRNTAMIAVAAPVVCWSVITSARVLILEVLAAWILPLTSRTLKNPGTIPGRIVLIGGLGLAVFIAGQALRGWGANNFAEGVSTLSKYYAYSIENGASVMRVMRGPEAPGFWTLRGLFNEPLIGRVALALYEEAGYQAPITTRAEDFQYVIGLDVPHPEINTLSQWAYAYLDWGTGGILSTVLVLLTAEATYRGARLGYRMGVALAPFFFVAVLDLPRSALGTSSAAVRIFAVAILLGISASALGAIRWKRPVELAGRR